MGNRLGLAVFASLAFLGLGRPALAQPQTPWVSANASIYSYFGNETMTPHGNPAYAYTFNGIYVELSGTLYENYYIAEYYPDYTNVTAIVVPGDRAKSQANLAIAGATWGFGTGTAVYPPIPYTYGYSIVASLGNGLYWVPGYDTPNEYTAYFYINEDANHVYGTTFIDCLEFFITVGANGIIQEPTAYPALSYAETPDNPPGVIVRGAKTSVGAAALATKVKAAGRASIPKGGRRATSPYIAAPAAK